MANAESVPPAARPVSASLDLSAETRSRVDRSLFEQRLHAWLRSERLDSDAKAALILGDADEYAAHVAELVCRTPARQRPPARTAAS